MTKFAGHRFPIQHLHHHDSLKMDVPSHKHSLRDLITHFVLTSRPYSYADNLIRGFLSCALIGKGSDPRSLTVAWQFSLFSCGCF